MSRETLVEDLTSAPDMGEVMFVVRRCEDGRSVAVHRARHFCTEDVDWIVSNINSQMPDFPPISEVDVGAIQNTFAACPPYVPPTPTVDEAKADKLVRIRGQCDAQFRAGYLYDFGGDIGPRRLDLRTADDKINWTLLMQEAVGYVSAGGGALTTTVRDAQNNPAFSVTYDVAKTFTQAMLAWGKAVYARKWALDEQVMAAATIEDVAAVDETAGWP